MRAIRHLGIGWLLLAAWSCDAAIVFDFETSALPIMEDFTNIGDEIVGIYAGNGVLVAEGFVGQTIHDPGGAAFETFSSIPSAPLTMAVPDTNDGLFRVSGAITALSIAGLAAGTDLQDIGEGVVSALFDMDVNEVGFSVVGADPGPSGGLVVGFYQRNGFLIDQVTIADVQDGDYVFTSIGDSFAGVSIANNDTNGVGYNNFRFGTVTAVPEPGAMTLIGVCLFASICMWSRLRRISSTRRGATMPARHL